MSVNPILSSINLQESYHTQASHSIHQPTFKEVLKGVRTNSITLEDDVELDKATNPITLKDDIVKVVKLDLGTINNKPVEITIGSEGGYGWTGAPMLFYNGDPSRPVDDRFYREVDLAFRAREAYTQAEHEEVGKFLGAIADLYFTTTRGYSIESYNEEIMPLWGYDTEEAIRRLGLNPDKPFTINGRTFILEPGNLLKEITNEEGNDHNIQQFTFNEVFLEKARINSIALENVVKLGLGTINNDPEESLVALAIKAYTQQFKRKPEDEEDEIIKKKRDDDNELTGLNDRLNDRRRSSQRSQLTIYGT